MSFSLTSSEREPKAPLELRVLPDSASLTVAATEWVLGALRETLARSARCSFALSGGETPRPVYVALAREQLDWSRVDFFFADERCVPPEHPDSNFRLAREALFAPLQLPASQLFRMRGELADADAAAREYEAALPPRLDVVLLGMGPDGHTCSLFPDAPAVSERARRVVAVENSPKPPPRRLTLTAPALETSARLFMLVAGAGKAGMVRRVLREEGPVEALPARLARRGSWYLDAAAAAELNGEGR